MHGLAQNGAAWQANIELADQLLELVKRQALGHVFKAHIQIPNQQFVLIGWAGLEGYGSSAKLSDLLEDPGVGHCTAPDHHAVGAAGLQPPQCIGGILDVAGADYGDTDDTLDVGGLSFWRIYDSVPNVPDGGMTVLLLGAALSGLGLISRKMS